MTTHHHQLLRLLCAGLNDIEEWRLGDPHRAAAKGYPREYAAPILDDWGILFVDVTLEAPSGQPVCHEVNGPNAVGSDALTGDSSSRAWAEVRQTLRRVRQLGLLDGNGQLRRAVVTIHAHQHWRAFRTGGEFYPRVERFAAFLHESLPGCELAVRGGADLLGAEQLTVVVGDVPTVAKSLTIDPQTRQFVYQDRPVVFLGNPNLWPELLRTGKVPRDAVDLRAFHAWRLVPIIHDKALQQLLFQDTAIRPLRHFEAHSLDEALSQTRQLLTAGPVVLKPNGTSGGTGIHVVVPGMTDDMMRARLDNLLGDCATKYGVNTEAFIYPLRGFEFVRSTTYSLPDGPRLWDLRVAVQFEPGKAQVYPVSLRLTPTPFDERTFHLDRDQWISNVSGRQVTLLKSGLDDDALSAVGMTPAKLDAIFEACVCWTMKAWDRSIRAGGCKGMIWEDDCENADRQFYPRDKF